MAAIKSFKGIRYASHINLEKVVTPPYDVISREEQHEYYLKNKYNIIRLILGKEYDQDNADNNRYTRAAETFNQWLAGGILEIEDENCIYLYEQNFTLPDGKNYSRKGFIALLKLEKMGEGSVKPHERTLSGPKEDRLNLIRHCKANFSQIFALYNGAYRSIAGILSPLYEKAPDAKMTDQEGIINYLWTVKDSNLIADIQSQMHGLNVYIADGHHRYETAYNYMIEMKSKNPDHTGKESYNYVMTMFVDMQEKGLIILPTHRAVKNTSENSDSLIDKLSENFKCKLIQFKNMDDKSNILNKLQGQMDKASVKNNHIFILYCGNNRFYWIELRNKSLLKVLMSDEEYKAYGDLDVAILQKLILEGIFCIDKEGLAKGDKLDYIKDPQKAIAQVDEGRSQFVFLLNPTSIQQVVNVAKSGKVMPQKSTYFYPKLLTGLVLFKHDV